MGNRWPSTGYYNTTVYVDNSPPIITKEIGSPYVQVSPNQDYWVNLSTEINITAVDDGCNGGVGLLNLKYRIWNDGTWSSWTDYTGNFTFSEECTHYLEINATDLLGNSIIDNETFHVDNTP
ncbi:MAG: hypothetical protein FE041_05815, partial [Thermoplasmata archaeon]